MSKNNNNKLVPKLRFLEFENDGEWEQKELNKLGKLINGLTYSPDDVREEGLLVLRSSNIKNSIIVLDDNVFVRTDIKGANLSEPNDILICVRNGSKALIGKNALIPEGMPLCTHGAFMTVFRSEHPKFTFQLFQTDTYTKKVAGDLGATINSINGSNFLKYEFLVPKNPDEKEKIAACLSSLDEVIAAESQKLDILRDHKKGLLQNLFPQEGETVPKFRFKEFEDSGEWEIKSIEDNIDLISGIALKSEELSDDKSGTPILRGINITEGEIRHSDEMDKFYLGAIENIEKYLVEENDIVIAMDGSKVGKNVAMISSNDAGSILIQRVARIRAIDSDVKYLYQHFLSNKFRNYVDVVNTSSGIPHISAKQIRDFEISFPPNIKEQQKIASTLSSVDDLISAQSQKLEALQFHKKGLLQGLFPNLNDVTA